MYVMETMSLTRTPVICVYMYVRVCGLCSVCVRVCVCVCHGRRLSQNEKRKAVFNELIGKLTGECWDKCVGNPGNKLSGYEQQCLSNCAQRFMDTSQFILKKFQR